MINVSLTLEELKELLADRYDPELLLEVLEINTEDLLEAFEDKLIDKRYKFMEEESEYELEEV